MRLAPKLALIVLSACVTSAPGTRIILDTAALENPAGNAGAAWAAYGAARATAYEELRAHGGSALTSDDYPVEVAARAALADVWKELGDKPGAASDAYLDALVRIHNAGFLEEYVLATFGKPGWTIPAEHLARIDASGFGPWLVSSGLAKLESPTLARLSTDRSPAVPGATLPDPEPMAPSRMPCTDSAEPLRRAQGQWSKESGGLAGIGVAAGDRGEFLNIVNHLASQEPYESRGVTWVSAKTFALAYYAGFCSIEDRDFPTATEYLERAIELAPYAPTPRLELAHVFVQRRDFERAEAQIDTVIASTEDRCTLGIAFRKRGFIFIELGRLEEARTAYRRSLDYDPKSKIAHSELELIDHEIAKAGGEPLAPYQPPASQTLLTECAPE